MGLSLTRYPQRRDARGISLAHPADEMFASNVCDAGNEFSRRHDEWRRRMWKCENSDVSLDPFSKERIHKAIFAFEPIDDLFAFELCNGLLCGCGVICICGREKVGGAYFTAASYRYCLEDARLERRELLDEECKMVVFAGIDRFKGVWKFVRADYVTGGCCLPDCVAKLLHKARRISRKGADGIEGLTRKIALSLGEAGFEEGVEVSGIDSFHGKGCGSAIERALRVEEYVRHPIADAAEENVGCVGVELDAPAHDCEDSFAVVYVENVLEFVKHDADLASGGLRNDCVKDGFERGRCGRQSRIQRKGRGAGGRIYRHDRSEIRNGAHDLRQPAVGAFEFGECGDESAADVGLVANAEKVGMKKRYASHVAHCFEHKGSLSGAPFALHYDILSRLNVGGELLFKDRTWAEKVAFDRASVLKRIHFNLPSLFYCRLTVVPLGIAPFGIIPFGLTECIVPNYSLRCNGAQEENYKEAA